MPNVLAYIVLGLWPVISAVLYCRMTAGRALLASLLLAYLFLPPAQAAFDLQLLPAINRENLPSLVAFVASLALWRERMRIVPESWAARLLLLVFIFSPIGTMLSNMEPLRFGEVVLPGLRFKDAVALVVNQAMLAMPLILAMNFLRRAEDHRDMMRALVLAGLLYSPLMLLEVRLSPQLNIWIYGFFQHSFEQMMRDGGFRPIVFLYHAIWVAFFAMSALIAAAALMRREEKGKIIWLGAALWLGGVLILCKTLASLVYGVVVAPLVVLLPVRMQIRVALVLGVLAASYPLLKANDLVPVEAILEQAAQIDPQRADSLRFRIDNEDRLLERAFEKPWFGWGSWGRNQIFDPVSGSIQTVPDGRWVIVIGTFGWPGFLAEYGLLVLPLLLLWWRSRRMKAADMPPFVGAIALLLAINLVDTLPNATLTPVTWLWAGALLGYVQRGRMPPDRLRSIM